MGEPSSGHTGQAHFVDPGEVLSQELLDDSLLERFLLQLVDAR